jgi:hypothetical protein
MAAFYLTGGLIGLFMVRKGYGLALGSSRRIRRDVLLECAVLALSFGLFSLWKTLHP